MTVNSDNTILSVGSNEPLEHTKILAELQSAITLIRSGYAFVIKDENRFHACLAIDGMSKAGLSTFLNTQRGRSPLLILTAERGQTLGFQNTSPISMPITASDTPQTLLAAASSHPSKINRRPVLEQVEATPAITLLTQAHMLPSCLFFGDIANVQTFLNMGAPVIEIEAIDQFMVAKQASLRRKSEAPVPVRGGIPTRMVVFEYATGENEIALMVGNPSLSNDLPIRIHSSCVTGDIFGSERCDCGDQLRLAIEKLHELGGGAVLYLDQEGRGIGLANKMRAYDLQDQSLDTVDANHALGFEDDCRNFDVAAAMIRALGWQKVSILTNNPKKINALKAQNIEVSHRIPHQAPVNENNQQYLRTKASRSGHLLKY